MYVPCCSIRAVSTAQATPDQHPEQTQIEQRPDFGNIAKRQTRPSPTQSTFSVDGALPGRRCAILAGSMHSPRLAGQIGGARTEQGRGGGDVRSGRLREPTSTGRARPRQAGGVPASVVRSSPHHGQSLCHRPPRPRDAQCAERACPRLRPMELRARGCYCPQTTRRRASAPCPETATRESASAGKDSMRQALRSTAWTAGRVL